jgi:hypothetical protein
MEDATAPPFVRKFANFWLFLLLPWMLIAPMSGLAFDGGRTTEAYIFLWSIWTYPVVLIIALILKRWVPSMMFRPLLNILGFVVSAL